MSWLVILRCIEFGHDLKVEELCNVLTFLGAILIETIYEGCQKARMCCSCQGSRIEWCGLESCLSMQAVSPDQNHT